MEKYVIIALILLFAVVYYFDTQSNNQITALEQSSTLEIDQNKLNKRLLNKRNKGSLWDSIISANKNKNYYKDRGIRPPIIKNSPDSDRSQCSKKPLFTEKIITKFAGYILEYPCTVRSSGTISTYFDEQDNSYSEYRLYLGVVLNGDEGSIWKLKHDDLNRNKMSFRVILKHNGRDVYQTPLVKQMDKMTKMHNREINGLTLYRDNGRIVGYLNDVKDASGHPPAISCSAAKETMVEDVFSLFETPIHIIGTGCSAAWALTKNIYLSVPASSIKSKYAYHFKDIFQMVNNGIKEIIVSTP